MEDKLKSFTTVLLICISFMVGFLFCDFITEKEVVVQMSGGELYYDNDGNELVDLPLIGEKTAEKIIKYREKNYFTDIRDIMNVEGIGEKTFEKIKEYITVE